jgi:molybdate transport system regulatory protein
MLHSPNPVRIRIRSASGDLFAMGPGKAELLIAIQKTGSIAAAGRQLGMSYQKTRQLVDEMNLTFVAPLVEGFKGGAQGGGAKITELGCEVLERYQKMLRHAEAAVVADMTAFKKLLAP